MFEELDAGALTSATGGADGYCEYLQEILSHGGTVYWLPPECLNLGRRSL